MAVDLARDSEGIVKRWDEVQADELGAALIEWARGELGVTEATTNWGPEVSTYLASVGIRYPAMWCAAFISCGVQHAERSTGVQSGTRPTALAKGFMYQLRKLGRWVTAAAVRAKLDTDPTCGWPLPGWIAVWDRGTPGRPYRGHTGSVDAAARPDFIGRPFCTVEGNAGVRFDEVARLHQKLDDPKLLGFGQLSGVVPW